MTKTAALSPCQETGLRAQFGCPRGRLGWIVGYLMALKNRKRSRFVLSLLDLVPRDRVIEVGFGSGSDLATVIAKVNGSVGGVDHSDVMLRMASSRNQKAVRQGKLQLHLAPAESLPFPDGSFDKLYSINAAQFFATGWRR